MALDLEAIRAKVQKLSSGKRFDDTAFWKPGPGEHQFRVLPMDLDNDIAWCRWFYYNIGNRSILAPFQFVETKENDPVQEFIRKLQKSKDPQDKELVKKLYPTMRAIFPVIVRGEESKGPRLWTTSKNIYAKIMGWIVKYGEDFRDSENGFDIELKITQVPGKKYPNSDVELSRHPSKLAQSKEQVNKWLASVPDINAIYKKRTPDEVQKLLTDWLNGNEDSGEEFPGEERPENGSNGSDKLDELVSQVSASTNVSVAKKPAPIPEQKSMPAKSGKKSSKTKEEPVVSEANDDLDDAFADLDNE